MTVTYGPFDKLPDQVTDAEYSEDQGSILFGAAVPDGVAGLPSDSAYQAVVSGGGTSVDFLPGVAFAQGFWSQITAAETKTVDPADAAKRIDRLVAELDWSANMFVPAVVKGTPGSATPPALVRDANKFQLRIGIATRGTDGSLTVVDDRDFGALEIHPTRSDNQPPADGRVAFEWQMDTQKLIRRAGDGSRMTLLENTGKITLSPAWPDYWHPVYDIVAYKINGTVFLRINVERRRRSTDPGSGSASFPLIVTLPAALRPPVNWQPMYYADGGGKGIAEIAYDTGECKLIAGDSIAVGVNVHISTAFPAT